MRPKAALRLLEEALRRAPDDAELLYLSGLARLRSGDPEGALEPLARSVGIDARVGFGEPYLVAAEALLRLDRLEEAEDALERYVDCNSSSVQALTRLALVRSKRHDRDGARRALREALDTWSQVPGFKRRGELGWWLRAQIARVFL
jgi:tetratricopeptide (TPR) repeat protein